VGLWEAHFHWRVLLQWVVLGWILPTLLAVGGIVLFFDKYTLANICFVLCAMFLFAKVAHASITSDDLWWKRMIFTFILFGAVGVGIVETHCCPGKLSR